MSDLKLKTKIKKETFGIRHFLQTNLKPEEISGDLHYPVYIQVTYRKKTVQIRSKLIEKYFKDENQLIGNKEVFDKILLDRKILISSYRSSLENRNINNDDTKSVYSHAEKAYLFFTQDVSELLFVLLTNLLHDSEKAFKLLKHLELIFDDNVKLSSFFVAVHVVKKLPKTTLYEAIHKYGGDKIFKPSIQKYYDEDFSDLEKLVAKSLLSWLINWEQEENFKYMATDPAWHPPEWPDWV